MSIITQSSDIVLKIIYNQDIQRIRVEKLLLKGGAMIAISAQQIALYQHQFTQYDPLTSKLIDIADIPLTYQFNQERPWVQSAKGGFVSLINGTGLLITPTVIKLYPDAASALQNKQTLLTLTFEKVNKANLP